MNGSSTAKVTQAAGRIALRQAGQNRWLRAGWVGISTTFRHVSRVLHLLFLQVAGVFFLAFAAAGGLAFAREYRLFLAGQPAQTKMAVAAAFALMFLWFAVSSFWRAARKERPGLKPLQR